MEGRITRCIECGGLVDSLNEDDEGEPCNACADRLLETLPGVFHRPWMESWPKKVQDEAGDEFDDLEDESPAVGPADSHPQGDSDQPA